MNNKWLRLAAELLDELSDKMGSSSCNDWDFPKGWTKAEKDEFCREVNIDNGTPEEYDPKHLWLCDFQVASFLSGRVRKMAERNEKMINGLKDERPVAETGG